MGWCSSVPLDFIVVTENNSLSRKKSVKEVLIKETRMVKDGNN